MLQSNWICKATLNILATTADIVTDVLPPGRLRCVRCQAYSLGAADGALYLRFMRNGVTPPNFAGIAIGGYDDWVPMTVDNLGGTEVFFFLDLLSRESGIEIMYRMSAADVRPTQLSFWYEPVDGDDDSHLSPLGNKTRGGIRS